MCIDVCPINTLPKRKKTLSCLALLFLSVCLQSLFPLVDLSTCADLSFVISFYSNRQGQTDLCKHFKLNQAALSQFFVSFNPFVTDCLIVVVFSLCTQTFAARWRDFMVFIYFGLRTHAQDTQPDNQCACKLLFFIPICIKGKGYVAVTKLC